MAWCKSGCCFCAALEALLPAYQQAVYKSGKAAGASADVMYVSSSATAAELQVFVFQGVAMNAVLLDFSMLLRARAMSVRFINQGLR